MKGFFIFPVLLILLFGNPAFSNNLADALSAFDNGDYETAFSLLKPLAESGNIEAQFQLGYMYKYGLGFEDMFASKNQIAGIKWLKKAAQSGHKDAKGLLSAIILIFIPVPDSIATENDKEVNKYIFTKKNIDLALKYAEELAQNNVINANKLLGLIYENGTHVPVNIKRSLSYYTKAAELGNLDAQIKLGERYLGKTNTFDRDLRLAFKWYKRAAEQGNAKSQYNLGKMYNYGGGVTQYYKAAVKWYKLAAEQGDVGAQFLLGVMYTAGKGTAKDLKKGFKWIKLAAERGLDGAQYGVGGAYALGAGVTRDYKAAVKWFKLAAEQGQVDAQFELSQAYYTGTGVTQDYSAAFNWTKMAAEQGHVGAQYNLGLKYVNGQGVIQDYTLAHMWWNIAASQGTKEAAEGRTILEEIITHAEIMKAQNLARDCVAKNYKDC